MSVTQQQEEKSNIGTSDMDFTFVTGNDNKLKEVREILGSDLINSKKIDLPELQGSAEEIVIAKAKEAVKVLNCAILVDDTSLEFNSLGGLPGPYVKAFVEKLGPSGMFKMLSAFDDKSGVAQCIFAYAAPGIEPILFKGRCPGTIVSPRGEKDFGWDPIFQPEGFKQTFAEMKPEEKNPISHRGLALSKLKEYFVQSEGAKKQCV